MRAGVRNHQAGWSSCALAVWFCPLACARMRTVCNTSSGGSSASNWAMPAEAITSMARLWECHRILAQNCWPIDQMAAAGDFRYLAAPAEILHCCSARVIVCRSTALAMIDWRWISTAQPAPHHPVCPVDQCCPAPAGQFARPVAVTAGSLASLANRSSMLPAFAPVAGRAHAAAGDNHFVAHVAQGNRQPVVVRAVGDAGRSCCRASARSAGSAAR